MMLVAIAALLVEAAAAITEPKWLDEFPFMHEYARSILSGDTEN
jgi:hypothetical protein